MKKRILSLLLVLMMLVTMLPIHAFATGDLETENILGISPIEEVPNAPFRITAPSEATVQVFRQSGFHNISPIEPQFTLVLEDGTQIVGFPSGGTHYRVSMEGKITRTGFTTSGDLTITFEENENPQIQIDQRENHRLEASTMVNVNSRNHLNMQTGDTFPLRAFRAAWEIVNSETANQIIQPDFHVNVLYGENVVSVTPLANQSSLFTLTALQPGTAVIEVYYDAIYNENRGVHTLYGATNPVRHSVIVISVDQNTAYANFNDWDTEFDTVYHLNTQTNGYFPLDATRISAVEVAHVANGTLGQWQSLSPAHGAYSVPVFAGNNIIRITDVNGAQDYQIVRGAQITPIINNGQAIIPGRLFTVRFEGLFTPAPKMGNIYNPSLFHLAGTHGNQIAYTFNGVRTTNGGQYNFINNHTLSFTAPETPGVFLLTNGNLPTSMWSFGSGFGIHRNLGHGGANNGGFAPTFTRFSSILPDVPLTVGTPQWVELAELEDLLEDILELDLGIFIPETVVPLQQAILNAQAIIVETNPSEEAILAAIATLQAAFDGLREAPFRITLAPEEIFPGDTVTLHVEGGFGAAQAQGASYQLRFSTTIPGRGTVTSSSSSNINADALRTVSFTIPEGTAPGEYRLHGGHLQRTVRVGFQVNQSDHFMGDFPEVFIRVLDPNQVNKSQLESAIIATNALVAPSYTGDSWQILEDALMAAITINEDRDATQEEVNEALSDLNAAVAQLVLRADKTALNAAINRGQSHVQLNYTDASWQALETRLTEALAVRDNSNATQEAVAEATRLLEAAIAGLVLQNNTGGNNNSGGGNNSGGTGTTPPPSQVQISVIDPNYHGPNDARVFLSNRFVTLLPNDTVYSVLRRTGLTIDSSDNALFGTYVHSINGWGEFDAGELSGWMYRVNGSFPDFSSSLYELRNGDRIEWLFTRDLGLDIGGGGATGGDNSGGGSTGGGSTGPGGGSGGGATGPGGGGGSTGETPPDTEENLPFTDVDESRWFFPYVQFVYDNGLMNGTGEGVFSPDLYLSRAMAVTILWRLAQTPDAQGNGDFIDVLDGQWYTTAIAWAREQAIANGYGDGRFGPHDNVTREQLAVMFYNFATVYDFEVSAEGFLGDFSDISSISTWAYNAMMWANANGLINGRTPDTLAPNGSASRAEAAAMLQRLYENILN